MTAKREAILSASAALIVILAILLCAGCLSTSIPVKDERDQGQNTADLQTELEENIAYVQQHANDLASMVHRLINDQRRDNHLDPLQWDQQLADIALSHSKDMAKRDYFDHISPEGEDFADRYEEHGYTKETRIGNQVFVGGENLFLYNVVASSTYDKETNEVHDYVFNNLEDLARSTVDGWMESPGHRENILTPFTREGIGVEVTDEGEVYITENFS
jgi:uncharacterized protein YkwD